MYTVNFVEEQDIPGWYSDTGFHYLIASHDEQNSNDSFTHHPTCLVAIVLRCRGLVASESK